MKRLVFVLGLCVCMAYGDEYNKQKAEFMSKNFDSKMGLEIKKFELKTETSKLLFKVAMIPVVYSSGLEGTDSNGGWGETAYKKFWNEYYGLQKRVKEICGTYITETKTKEVTKRDWFGFESKRNESYDYVKQNYTPAQQKCIKSLATLELEMNKDILKWNLEQMKSDDYGKPRDRKRDLTPSYQFADMLWEKFKKEAKLGVIKDFNKPGMEQFVKGVFYWWIVGAGIEYKREYEKLGSINDFFHFYKEKVDGKFSFLYNSMETNNKELEKELDASEYYERGRIYLSTKEYQEAIRQEQIEQEKKERTNRAKALKKFISNDVGFSQESLEFNACLGLGDDENQNAEILFSGQYAEIFDKKYYNEEYGGSHSMKEDTSDELKKHTLYRQLAWCAVKKAYESTTPKEYQDMQDNVRGRWSNRYHRVALDIADKKWQAMTEKYPCVDYESAIKSPWYKDEAKIENLLKELDKDFRPIIKNHNKEYEQCEKKIFESGREKCKEKLSEKTLKQLQAKLK